MVKTNDLYNKVKLPVDENLLNELISKYLNIDYDDMKNDFNELSKLLYTKINIVSKNNTNKFNKEDLNYLLKEINQDFTNSGTPYNPSEHNGITNPLGIMAGWNTFQSWNLLGTEKIKSKDISHRFYFGIANEKLYELSKALYDYFKESNIPFYFKTNSFESMHRRDNLVLYTSTPLLEQTLQVIETLKQERPDLIAQCCNPSILTGKLDDKIGYATESHNYTTSYTDLVISAFTSSVKTNLENFIKNNPKIEQIYINKLQEYSNKNIDINSKLIKDRLLFDILLNNDSNFKESLLSTFKSEIANKGIDINNICFNEDVKKELEYKDSSSITSYNEQPDKVSYNENSNEQLKSTQNIKDVSESTNLAEIVEVIQALNPNVQIRIGNSAFDSQASERFFCSIPVDKLVLPEGFYYNDKNGITNKHNTKSGNYCSLSVEDLGDADESILLPNKQEQNSSYKDTLVKNIKDKMYTKKTLESKLKQKETKNIDDKGEYFYE